MTQATLRRNTKSLHIPYFPFLIVLVVAATVDAFAGYHVSLLACGNCACTLSDSSIRMVAAEYGNGNENKDAGKVNYTSKPPQPKNTRDSRKKNASQVNNKDKMRRPLQGEKATESERVSLSDKNTINDGESKSKEMSVNDKREEDWNEACERMASLENVVSRQSAELKKIRDECENLRQATEAFSCFINALRGAGIDTDSLMEDIISNSKTVSRAKDEESLDKEHGLSNGTNPLPISKDSLFDEEIFGKAPTTIEDAAEAAGSSILSAVLGGKRRMLVDVRDAELSQDPEVLVQFVELAILPLAEGLEGLGCDRNRIKIVFPKVSQLQHYHATMSLNVPDVITHSTLGFEPVSPQDNLIIILSPHPTDTEGLAKMNALLTDGGGPRQPVVIINSHMLPLGGPASKFSLIYLLRLLSVQYVAGDVPPEEWEGKPGLIGSGGKINCNMKSDSHVKNNDIRDGGEIIDPSADHDNSQSDIHRGQTRGMVVRAYPHPWHVFVDISQDCNADFQVAATFDHPPNQEEVSYSIVECLEGSEKEDELVAEQMKKALNSGEFSAVTDLDINDEVDGFYDDWEIWGETDTV